MKHSILIIGASGLVGSYLYRQLSQSKCVGTSHKQQVSGLVPLDSCNLGATIKFISQLNPSIIINAAGLTHVDRCEQDAPLCHLINVVGNQNLLIAAQNVNAKYIYISTDYVFDGKNGPYSESDTPNPINTYGRAKRTCELNIINSGLSWMIVRTTGIYGLEHAGKNFVVGLLSKLNAGQYALVPYDQTATPTFAPQLAHSVAKLVENGYEGFINIVGPDYISRYDFALKIANNFGFNSNLIRHIPTATLGQHALRPLKGGLKSDLYLKHCIIPQVSIDEGLFRMKFKSDQQP